MLRRVLRIGLTLGFVGGVAVAIAKALRPRHSSGDDTGVPAWEPLVPLPASAPVAWVEPTGDACPTTHPVKAKLSSKIFHLPGMANYERTKPDRCYLDAAAAEADGLRPSKR